MEWDLAAFRSKVELLHPDVYDQFLESLDSFAWKRNIAVYHLDEYKKILGNHLGIDSESISTVDASKTLEVLFNSRLSWLHCEAHLIAAAQSIHSLHDILANVIYWALRLDRVVRDKDPVKNEKKREQVLSNLSFATIVKIHDGLIPQAIVEKHSNILFDSSYRYLAAFVNRTKHISLVKARPSANFVEDRGGFRFASFKYRGEVFPELWSFQFNEKLVKVWAQVAGLGMSLDHSIGKSAPT